MTLTTLVLSLIACGGDKGETGEDTSAGTVDTSTSITDTSSTGDSVHIEELYPPFGPVAGGTVVTISGGPFGQVDGVSFDGEAAEVLSVGEEAIEVRTPEMSTLGNVDVMVTTEAGSGETNFRTLDRPDRTGVVTAAGILESGHYYGNYWAPSAVDYHSLFYRPVKADRGIGVAAVFGHELDACQDDLAWDDVYPAATPVSEGVEVFNSQTSTEIPWESDDEAYSGEVEQRIPEGGEMIDIAFPESDQNPEFILRSAAVGSAPFTFSSTPSFPFTELGYFEKGDITLEWDAPGAFGMALRVRTVDMGSGNPVEQTWCLLENDGEYTIPASMWKEWDDSLWLMLSIGSITEHDTVLPWNNSTNAMASVRFLHHIAVTE